MIALLTGLWTGGTFARIAEYLGAVALIFLIGFAAGQHYETKAIIDKQADQAAQEEAAIGTAFAQQREKDQAAVNAAAAKAKAADDTVHAKLTMAALDADKAQQAALEALDKERTRNAEMAAEMDSMRADSPQMFDVNDPRCGWGPNVRLRLDEASGAVAVVGASGDGSASSTAGGVADAAAAAPNPPDYRPYPAQGIGLSCRELVDGYVALARHDRLAAALYAAWQVWWDTTN